MNDSDPIPTARPSWLVTLLCLVVVVGGAIGAIALFGTSSADAATPRTQQIVLRPVTASGHAAKGYKVVTDHRRAIECYAQSSYAVNSGIAVCGSSADNTLSCWPSANRGQVLCLTDPYVRTLRSITLSGAFPATRARKHAAPQALTLNTGMKFLARSGGAWSTVSDHRSWVGYYYQRSATEHHTIYGPRGTDGINHRHARWFVTTYRGEVGHGTRHDVTTAYYVGTAR